MSTSSPVPCSQDSDRRGLGGGHLGDKDIEMKGSVCGTFHQDGGRG